MRLIAILIDTVLALVVTALLSSTTGWYFAERAVVTFRIYSPDTIWNGPLPLVLGAVSTVSYGFAFAWVVAHGGEAGWGASLGKILTGRRIASGAGVPADGRRLWLRFVLKTLPCWLFCLALLVGRWEVVVLAVLASTWALVDLVAALSRHHRLWHDRAAGTQVVGGRRLRPPA